MDEPSREGLHHGVTARIGGDICPPFSNTDKDELNIQNPFFVIQVTESFLKTKNSKLECSLV